MFVTKHRCVKEPLTWRHLDFKVRFVASTLRICRGNERSQSRDITPDVECPIPREYDRIGVVDVFPGAENKEAAYELVREQRSTGT